MEETMMTKDLLVVLDAEGRQAPAQRFALSLAAQTGAHLTAAGLAVQIVAPVSFGGEYPYELMAQALEQARATVASGFEALRTEAPVAWSRSLSPLKPSPASRRRGSPALRAIST